MTDDHDLLHSLRSAVDHLLVDSEADRSSAPAHLATVADTARRLSPEFRRRNPSVPWMVLAEIDRVIKRAGDDLDPGELSATLQRDIPELHRRLSSL